MNLKLFIFEDPGLYYGAEFIPVVADNENQAHYALTEYLKKIGRERHIKQKHTYTKGNTSMEKDRTWELAENWESKPCATDLPTKPGVLVQLIHACME